MRNTSFFALLFLLLISTSGYGQGYKVKWANLENVGFKETGQRLTCSEAVKWGQSGAASILPLDKNEAGQIVIPFSENNLTRAIGLGVDSKCNHFRTIDYCFLISDKDELEVYESGQLIARMGTLKQGDIISIERDINGVVTYLKNGRKFVTSRTNSTSSLYANAAFQKISGFFANVSCSFPMTNDQNEVYSGELTVDLNGGGDFTSLYDCLSFLTDYELVGGGVQVVIKKGTYNEIGDFSGLKLKQASGAALTIASSSPTDDVFLRLDNPLSFTGIEKLSITGVNLNSLNVPMAFSCQGCNELSLSKMNIMGKEGNNKFPLVEIQGSSKISVSEIQVNQIGLTALKVSDTEGIQVERCELYAQRPMSVINAKDVNINSCELAGISEAILIEGLRGKSNISGCRLTSTSIGLDMFNITGEFAIVGNEVISKLGVSIDSYAGFLELIENDIKSQTVGIRIKNPDSRTTNLLDRIPDKLLNISMNKIQADKGITMYSTMFSSDLLWNNIITATTGMYMKGILAENSVAGEESQIGGNLLICSQECLVQENCSKEISLIMNTMVNSSSEPAVEIGEGTLSICGNNVVNEQTGMALVYGGNNLLKSQYNNYFSDGQDISNINLPAGDDISQDPMFVLSDSLDYRPGPGTKLLDVSYSCIQLTSDEVQFDVLGEPRKDKMEIGALEADYGVWNDVEAYVQLRDGVFLNPGSSDYGFMVIDGLAAYNQFSLSIIDNELNQVFQTSNPDLYWNGVDQSDGSLVPEGAYQYLMELDGKSVSGLVYVKYE